jgi:energy-coupling factor transport system permease protein
VKYLNNIVFGQYIDTDSPVHRIDPRVKFFCLLGMVIATSLYQTGPFFAFLFLLLTTYASDLPLKYPFRNLRFFYWFFLFIGLFHLFLTPGSYFSTPLLLGLKISREGFYNALIFSLRLIILIVLAALFTTTTSPSKLTQGFERFFYPLSRLGLPVRDLAMVITIAITFIPLIFEESDRILKAQTARGINYASKNILRRARNYLSLFVPLFLNSFRRAEALALALEIRGYSSTKTRTYMYELKLSMIDFWAIATTAMLFLCASFGDRLCVI